MPTPEVCRKHGLSPATFYKLNAKSGDMDVSGAAKLRALGHQNAKPKRLMADTSISGARVARELDALVRIYGKPAFIESFNGSVRDEMLNEAPRERRSVAPRWTVKAVSPTTSSSNGYDHSRGL